MKSELAGHWEPTMPGKLAGLIRRRGFRLCGAADYFRWPADKSEARDIEGEEKDQS